MYTALSKPLLWYKTLPCGEVIRFPDKSWLPYAFNGPGVGDRPLEVIEVEDKKILIQDVTRAQIPTLRATEMVEH